MTHHENAKLGAYAKQEKPIFWSAVWVVVKLDSVLIKEHSLGLFERDMVLPLVLPVFLFVPFESQLTHNYTVNIL